jgi:anti-sigma B factor antagonist
MSSKHGTTNWLEREDFGGVTLVRLKPPKILDDNTIRAILDPIYSIVADMGRSNIVLNLAAVEYLPSIALGKLVMLSRKAQASNGRLALCQLTPTVEHTLESTHLKDLFTICATEQEALQSFS